MNRIITALSLVVLTATGCGAGPSLEGEWEGDLSCTGGGYEDESFDVMVELEREEDIYEGDGEIDLGAYEGMELRLEFSIELEKEEPRGEQELDADLDDCDLYVGGDSDSMSDCEVEDVEWDGEDEIVAEVPYFLGLDWNCEMTLER
jgi:hypothetical protein